MDAGACRRLRSPDGRPTIASSALVGWLSLTGRGDPIVGCGKHSRLRLNLPVHLTRPLTLSR